MGASHSGRPRSVSMDNPGVIDISDEVVQRLKRGVTQQKQEKASDPISPPPKAEKPSTEPAKPAPVAKRVPSAPPSVYQSPTPVYVGPVGHTMTAIDVRRQKELEFQQNDEIWRKRMNDLEETLKKTNQIMEQELLTSMEDVRGRFATAAPIHQLPPCQDMKAKLISCLKAYHGEPLRCSEEVGNFRNCVNVHRVAKLEEKVNKTAEKSESKAVAKGA